MPEDPSEYIQALCKHRYFETVSLTAEDRQRAAYYAQNAQRQRIVTQSGDLDAFLSSLGMTASVAPVNELNIERVAQLVNKSNQFNLTTRRRTLAEIRVLSQSPAWMTFTVSLRDSLGDNGLISVVFLQRQDGALDIDTWLMSCRVLQRGVEQFVLNELAACARGCGSARLRGVYIPSDKNALVKDHYAKLGFRQMADPGPGTTWELAIDANWTPLQTHIKKELPHG
jgi:FkbH-like protein